MCTIKNLIPDGIDHFIITFSISTEIAKTCDMLIVICTNETNDFKLTID